MYYDLVASLPRLPFFQHADRLPITPLRLAQRLRLLSPEHAAQLDYVRPLVSWRPQRFDIQTDEALRQYSEKIAEIPLKRELREYVTSRLAQQWLVAALRYRQNGMKFPASLQGWGTGLNVQRVQAHWDEPGFGLGHVHRWLPAAANCLSTHDLLGLERLLIELNWGWLIRYAEQDMFGFPAVFSYVFRWDLLQSWLQNNPVAAKARFTELVDEVTHVEHV